MKSLYINLDSRHDRRRDVEKEFKKVGLKVERMEACTGDNPMLAFNQSVYKAMGLGKGDTLMLFEDDVEFTVYGDALLLPDGFMSVHLGCNLMGAWQMPTPYSNQLALLHNCYQSHATIYSAECIDFVLANLDPNRLNEDNNIFDDWFRRKVLPQGRSFVMKPMIAYQRPSFSNIWGVDAHYLDCFHSGNDYLKTL